jgi:PAS domain S-box-containing protein
MPATIMTVSAPPLDGNVGDASLYAAIYEHIPDGILLLDNNRRCLDANAAARQLLGYTREELQQRTIDDLTIPADRPEIPGRWQVLLQQRRCHGLWRALTRPGDILYADTRCQAHIYSGVHLCLFRDSLPLSVQAEYQLLQQILDVLPVGLLVSDTCQPQEPIIYVNRTAVNWLGSSREKLLGQSVQDAYQSRLDPQSWATLIHLLRHSCSGQCPAAFKRHDGRVHTCTLHLIALPQGNNPAAFCLHVWIDREMLKVQPQADTSAGPPGAAGPISIPDEVRIATAAHILVVEDEEAVREFIRLVLLQAGYRVTVACDGQEAWKLFSSQPQEYQLILSDVLMPRLNGTELVSRIRTLHPQIPVLFISGFTGTAGLNLPLHPSLEWLLEKPFGIDQLLQAVRTALATVGSQ